MPLCEVQYCKIKKYIDKIFKEKVEKCLKSELSPTLVSHLLSNNALKASYPPHS